MKKLKAKTKVVALCRTIIIERIFFVKVHEDAKDNDIEFAARTSYSFDADSPDISTELESSDEIIRSKKSLRKLMRRVDRVGPVSLVAETEP